MPIDPTSKPLPTPVPMVAKPVSAIQLPRPMEYATSIVVRGGAVLPALPDPWENNQTTTVFLANWHRDELLKGHFQSIADCCTMDPDIARRTGRVLIRPSTPGHAMRLVIDFEDNKDSWAAWPFVEMERFRAALKAAYPTLKIGAYVPQAYLMVGSLDPKMRDRLDKLKLFVAPFDFISPCLYYHDGDDIGAISHSKQFALMRAWENSIAPGKPLVPCVWWFVEHKGYTLCTREQFWDIQIAAALSCKNTEAICLWGDINGAFEARVFEQATRAVINRITVPTP